MVFDTAGFLHDHRHPTPRARADHRHQHAADRREPSGAQQGRLHPRAAHYGHGRGSALASFGVSVEDSFGNVVTLATRLDRHHHVVAGQGPKPPAGASTRRRTPTPTCRPRSTARHLRRRGLRPGGFLHDHRHRHLAHARPPPPAPRRRSWARRLPTRSSTTPSRPPRRGGSALASFGVWVGEVRQRRDLAGTGSTDAGEPVSLATESHRRGLQLGARTPRQRGRGKRHRHLRRRGLQHGGFLRP